MRFAPKGQLAGLALASMLAVSSAIDIHLGGFPKRQELSTGVTTTAGSASPSVGESSVPSVAPSSAEPSATPTPSEVPSSTAPTASSTPAPESTPSTSSSSTPASTPSSSVTSSATRTPSASTSVEALVSSQTVEFVTTIVTVSGSQTIAIPVTSRTVNAVTTGFATHTTGATLGGVDGGKGSAGLSDNSKKIIGGVVGGVGGAILLGGIAIVAWRLKRKRQNQEQDEDDYLAGNNGSPLREKRHSHAANTPFQSTLESYHNPAGKPNTAANF